MSKFYTVAELDVVMEPKHEPLLSRARAYETSAKNKADADLRLSEETLSRYRTRYPEADDSLIEYMVTGSVFYRSLIQHNGILLHSSAVVLDNKAYLFSAPSGTGKSTHTSLWLKEFPDAVILNDDKPAIRILEDGIFVYGTPWSGKTDLNLNRKVPLQGIAFLERGLENSISAIPSLKCLENLLNQTVRPGDKESASKLFDLLDQILARVPIYKLTCNMNPEAAHVSYEAMSKGEVK
ncbi:MAG: hypothetical protein E7580_03800 [Ruminococcaceae bacterium]|nr:hypothetical protein [Oscillospiraceae bacterium]